MKMPIDKMKQNILEMLEKPLSKMNTKVKDFKKTLQSKTEKIRTLYEQEAKKEGLELETQTQETQEQDNDFEDIDSTKTIQVPKEMQPPQSMQPIQSMQSMQSTEREDIIENAKIDLNEDMQTTSTQKTQDGQNSISVSKHTLLVKSLRKSFGKKEVVKGLDFSMQSGEVLGLLGPNGCGKTTTFYMIVGFYKPTRGQVFLDGQKISGLPMYKRALLGISYLPQEPSIFRKLSVEDNIYSILETRKDLDSEGKKSQLEELISEFDIGRIRKQPAYTLSGGERRRTEIARSLAIQPKFLLLDEPFAGIDPIAVADIKDLVSMLSRKGIGVLITDHNVRDTLEITTRSIIVSDGQIVIQGPKDEILQSELARKIYLGEKFSM